MDTPCPGSLRRLLTPRLAQRVSSPRPGSATGLSGDYPDGTFPR
jgi:hypothetical protein